ncbi:hypothetical protein F2Q70_00014670 [Brassica cretica]|uniref:FLZ-type domain-containing protein n=1 Tax=Brassica cretica TaxID=69181 RepID=A0A8S9HWI9_BRACR|nr:hypothetical protein F2Q70_00014670 [Brassica cretica]
MHGSCDRAFCSVEYRSKQMVMDEEESFRRDKCSFMAVKATKPDSPARCLQVVVTTVTIV